MEYLESNLFRRAINFLPIYDFKEFLTSVSRYRTKLEEDEVEYEDSLLIGDNSYIYQLKLKY